MAAATYKGPRIGECHGTEKMERNFSGKRRVFVQTEAGFVHGLDLDRTDNAHTVKRKVQLALNIPTEERSLIYGDMVLRNDLSVVRNDSPLLLARNLIHRSSSSPCFSPTGQDLQQKDQSGPIEILGFSTFFAKTREIVENIVKAMHIGIDPIPIGGGLGGAYYFKNCHGEDVAIVKPTDEEPYAPNNPKGFVGKALGQPGLKRSVRVGETGYREVAAYLLDYDHFARVPSTALVKVTHSIFNVNDGVDGKKHRRGRQVSKLASLQEYVSHDFDAGDHGTSGFPVTAVHRIGILDMRILNTDRHAGNILVRKLDKIGKFGEMELVPIDHGLCLPESLEDPYFEWIHWPQASLPFSDEELDYIDLLDPVQDCEMLRKELPMIREACLRVLVLCTTFLKKAAAFGLCLAEIGELMSREFRGHEEKPSELELICTEARRLLAEGKYCESNVGEKEEVQFQIDPDEDCSKSPLCMAEQAYAKVRNPFSKLLNTVKEDKHEEPKRALNTNQIVQGGCNQISTVSNLSVTLKNISIEETSWRRSHAVQKSGFVTGTSSGNRSVNEQLPASSSFVRIDDLNEEEWIQFLENFQMLLLPAFANHKSATKLQKQRQRLGTSCQF